MNANGWMKRLLLLAFVATWVAFGLPARASGTPDAAAVSSADCTLFVATTGSDAHDGRTEATAFRTPQQAVRAALPGDTVCIRGGSYSRIDSDPWTAGTAVRILPSVGLGRSGEAARPIVYRAYGDGKVTFDLAATRGTSLWIEAEYLEFHDLTVTCSSIEPGSVGIFLSSEDSQAGSGTLTSNHIVFDTVEVTRCATGILGRSNDSEFRAMDLHENGRVWYEDQAVYLTGARNRIVGSRIHDNASTGIQLWTSMSDPQVAPIGNIIESNLIYANGYSVVKTADGQGTDQYGYGIVVGSHAGGRDNIIRNNLIFANLPHAIALSGWSRLDVSGTQVLNNTITANVVGLDVGGESADLIVKNNVIYNNSVEAIRNWVTRNRPDLIGAIDFGRYAGSDSNLYAGVPNGQEGDVPTFDTYTLDYNLWDARLPFTWPVAGTFRSYASLSAYQTATGNDEHSLAGDPLFRSPATDDFRPRPDSPAIDAGASLSEVTTDIEGTPRPQGSGFDLGAYEHPAAGGSTFDDVPASHPLYAYIEALFRAGFTVGCSQSPPLYCPEQGLKRSEMAVFMERAEHGAGYVPPTPDPANLTFADVPASHWAVEWIEGLWRDQYTAGCQSQPQRRFCPDSPHSRAEASVFGLRMKFGRAYQPPVPTPLFSDVPVDSWFFGWAHAAYAAGLLPACEVGSPPRFCPDDTLTRAWAAYMIVKAKGLPLPGETPTPTPSATSTATPTPSATPTPAAGPTLAGCPLFPASNIWNARVDSLPVHARSADYVASIGPDTGLHPDFGSGTWDGGPIGIPFNIVPATQPRVPIAFDYADESDPGPYPIPPDAAIEGGPQSTGDRHILVLVRDSCLLFETFSTYPQPDGSWLAGSGAIYDLRSHALRPAGWTSADAAGLPILNGLVRYEEVSAGEIRHALRFTARYTQRAFVWPARHFASSSTDPARPPMGMRFRLKASFDISGFPPEVRVILKALQQYGLILADNGGDWFISGAPDERWDNDVLRALKSVHGRDFEAVDTSSLMVHPDSGATR